MVFLACLLAGVGVASRAQEVPATPKELHELTTKFLETRKREVDEPFAVRQAQVDKNYLNALSQASQKAAAEGDLETVLELRKETERIGKGGGFPGVTAYQRPKARELVKTYGDYLAQTESERANKVNALAAQLDTGLRALLADLTKQGRVEDAIAVKTFREGTGLKSLISGGASKDADAAMATFFTPSEAPAAPPATAPAPTGPARLVIVPVKGGGARHPAAESIATADLQDLTYVCTTNHLTIGAVRADGSIVLWDHEGGAPQIVPGKATYGVKDHTLPLVGLNADGTLVATASDDAELTSRLQSETGVTHIAASSGVLSVVHADGRLAILGPRADVPTAAVMNGMKEVSQVGFSGAAFSSVLKTDGTVIEVSNGSPREQARAKGIVKLHAHQLGENKSGEVISWGPASEEVTKALGRNPRQVFFLNRRFGGIRSDGSVYLAEMDDTGGWRELSDLAKALEGARSFTWLSDGIEGWIVALLPAEVVFRSGFWELEELAAARK